MALEDQTDIVTIVEEDKEEEKEGEGEEKVEGQKQIQLKLPNTLIQFNSFFVLWYTLSTVSTDKRIHTFKHVQLGFNLKESSTC